MSLNLFTPTEIATLLEQQKKRPVRFWFRKPRKAVVALCLRNHNQKLEVLMIQRAKREGDPWSGHMAFPGGHKDEVDFTELDTAIRETYEEVQLDLKERSSYLGPLNPVRAIAKGISIRMIIYPVVFYVFEKEPKLTLNHEVADTVWIPLEGLNSGEYDSVYSFQRGKIKLDLPCWEYEGYTVWGLSYRMLRTFLELLNKNL